MNTWLLTANCAQDKLLSTCDGSKLRIPIQGPAHITGSSGNPSPCNVDGCYPFWASQLFSGDRESTTGTGEFLWSKPATGGGFAYFLVLYVKYTRVGSSGDPSSYWTCEIGHDIYADAILFQLTPAVELYWLKTVNSFDWFTAAKPLPSAQFPGNFLWNGDGDDGIIRSMSLTFKPWAGNACDGVEDITVTI